jgi:hypothetical protein
MTLACDLCLQEIEERQLDRWKNIQQGANDHLIKNEHQGASSVIDITKMVQPLPSFECCNYKVLDPLRKLNEEVYNPQVISIEPIHHGKKKKMPKDGSS